MNRLDRCTGLLLVLGLGIMGRATAAESRVSSTGKDANPGTPAAPWQVLIFDRSLRVDETEAVVKHRNAKVWTRQAGTQVAFGEPLG